MDVFQPIHIFAEYLTFTLLKFNHGSYIGNTLSYFIYDIIKIGILLVIINFIMAITRYYLPNEKIRDLLTKRRWFGLDYVFAAVLGVITPFCSCSSIPLFIGFLSAGIPLGVTFTFLISSPLVNEASLILFPALFGLRIAALYNFVGIIISIAGGYLIQKLHMEKYVIPELIKPISSKYSEKESNKKLSKIQLISYWFSDGMKITREVFLYVVIGVGIGALIHGFVPESIVLRYLSSREWWTVPLAVILGAPLYANSVSVLPIVEALFQKGVPIGTGLALMTSVVTISLPQAFILSKVMKGQLLAMFFGITIVGIILMGYLFNWVS